MKKKKKPLTERFEYGVGLKNLLLHPCGHIAGHRAQVLQDEFGCFRFASTRFTGYYT